VVNFEPLKGNIVVELATNIGFAMVDRLLGGSGVALDKSREFSEIELTILERIFNTFIELLREPWQNVIKISPRLERIETNSQFAQIIAPTDMIAIVTLTISIGEVEGLMNICLPYSCLESVMDKLNTKYWFSTMQEKDENTYKETIEGLISKAQIPIRVLLGESTITVNDFVNLQRGDVIKLNMQINDELDVYVGNIKKFTALPGSSNENYAVRLTSIYDEE
ncbi:MAG: FliM/FliN family flagellar motor switch protein, partial [Lachnospiraceae bacterium]|nr:FliM/FliN family flagellar motor switch protein [Lachnospiraceae bacterium]